MGTRIPHSTLLYTLLAIKIRSLFSVTDNGLEFKFQRKVNHGLVGEMKC